MKKKRKQKKSTEKGIREKKESKRKGKLTEKGNKEKKMSEKKSNQRQNESL